MPSHAGPERELQKGCRRCHKPVKSRIERRDGVCLDCMCKLADSMRKRAEGSAFHDDDTSGHSRIYVGDLSTEPDGTDGYWDAYREGGKFGSYPSHDDHGDESSP
jgi:hypothetical protein